MGVTSSSFPYFRRSSRTSEGVLPFDVQSEVLLENDSAFPSSDTAAASFPWKFLITLATELILVQVVL